MSADQRRVIVKIDLRGKDPAVVTSKRPVESLVEHAPGGDAQRVDFTRVILIDNTTDLVWHHEAYAHLRDANVNITLLCLAVGPGDDADPAVAISRPYQLRPPKAATLWVGDQYGVGWRMDSGQADVVHLPAGHEAAVPGDGLPAELVEVLSVPKVFDLVVELADAMPYATASPGLRIIRGDVAPAIVAEAQRAAIARLTDPVSQATDLSAASGQQGLIAPPGQAGGRAGEVIRAGSPIDTLYQKCRRASAEAMSAARGMLAFGGDGRRALRALRALADTLTEFSEMTAEILDAADPRTGFTASHRDQLSKLGIDLGHPALSVPAKAVDALTEYTLGALDRCEPLPAIAQQLRAESDRLVPPGNGRFLDRAKRACPPDLISRLRTPPAMLPRLAPPGLLLATFVACAIAGAWPRPAGLGAALAVVCTALANFAVQARGSAVATRRTATIAPALAASQLGAALVGAGCGLALSRAVKIRVPGGIGGIGAGAAVAVVLVAVVAWSWWAIAANRWLRALALSRLAGVPDTLRGLLTEAARSEWQVAGERAATSDLARVMAMIADDIADSLLFHAEDLPDQGTYSDGSSRPQGHDQIAEELAAMDLAAAAGSTIERLVRTLGQSGLARLDTTTVSQEMLTTLTSYRVHLATTGLHEPPPFGRVKERRADLVNSLLERDAGLLTLIGSEISDELITQLCAPEHLGQLETASAAARLIRFAPRAAQSYLDAAVDHGGTSGQHASLTRTHPVEWTSDSPVAGLLRLVPLRQGSVREIMAASTSPQIGPGPGGGPQQTSGWGREEDAND